MKREIHIVLITIWLLSVAHFFFIELTPLKEISKWDVVSFAVIFFTLIAGEVAYYKKNY